MTVMDELAAAEHVRIKLRASDPLNQPADKKQRRGKDGGAVSGTGCEITGSEAFAGNSKCCRHHQHELYLLGI